MAIVDQLRHRWTRADYALLHDGHLCCELVDGEIIDVSPMSNRHRQAVTAIVEAFLRESDRTAYTVNGQVPIVLDDHSEPEPDISVARGTRRRYDERDIAASDLVMVVEVSDSTLRFDREIKLPLYAISKIPEVWIVDLKAQTVEVNRNPVGRAYESVTTVGSDGRVDMPWGASISVDEMLHGAV
jgi:Uma2 family endonuclease